MSQLFEPVTLGRMALANRVVMAPMTRSRAEEDSDCVSDLHVRYYSQRATAGLIITEGAHPSKNAKGYCRTPGIYNQQQVAAWKKVVDAVHAEGGKIVLQLMHCGRVANAENKAADAETVAPSAIQANDKIFTNKGMLPMDAPRALTTAEVADVIEEYRQATVYAFEAGFDGVELHCTSGYLPAQFLSTGSNKRDDQYGGSLENRLRFVLEALAAIASVDGSDRVGMRICPGNPFNDLQDDDPEETFAALLDEADKLNLAYLHVIRLPKGPVDNLALARKHFNGPLIVNDSYDAEEANQEVESGQATAVSFGRDFIANPDLVRRMKEQLPLSKLNPSSLYTAGPEGLVDYPAAD